VKVLIYFETLESAHLTTHCHKPIGPNLNYTAVETSDLPYLVAFKRLLIADSALFYPWPTPYNSCLLLTPLCFIRGHLSTTAVYCWLRTVLSVTDCVQLLPITHSALFYPWPPEYNCCLLLTPHCFIRDRLCTTLAYYSLRSVLSVTTWVQLMFIADSALFYPWQTVYNCSVLLFLHFFIRDYLCTTAAYRWLSTFIPDHLYATVAYCSLCFAFPWRSLYNCCLSLTPHCLFPDRLYTTAAFSWFRAVLSVTVCVHLPSNSVYGSNTYCCWFH